VALTTSGTLVNRCTHSGQVAQLVEQGIENPRVGGSIPSLATAALLAGLTGGVLLAGCGDKCEVLCTSVTREIGNCKPESMSWNDLGARNRSDFSNECRQQWDRERIDLSASDLRLSLETCADADEELEDLECAEVMALYGDLE
jgi:hypothetical protein